MSRLTLLLLTASPLFAAERETAPRPTPVIDLSAFASPATAVKANPKAFAVTGGVPAAVGVLGVAFKDQGPAVIDDVAIGSAAEKAGLKNGDAIVALDGKAMESAVAAKAVLRGRFAGDTVRVLVARAGKNLEITATFEALSKPMSETLVGRAILGLRVAPPKTGGGVEITSVTEGGGAAKAGLKLGDVLLKVNDRALDSETALTESLSDKKPGDSVLLLVKRDKEELRITATTYAVPATTTALGWDDRLPTKFAKPAYKLAIIGVEYPDTKHNEKIAGTDWEESLFSRDTFTKTNATGGTVFGSMADYYHELSYGKLKVEGGFLGWFEVAKKKMDYNLGSSTKAGDKGKYFSEVMDKVIAKLGKDALKDYDGVFFMYAGDGVDTSRGGLYWPHRATFTHDRKRYSYFIMPELKRGKMNDISTTCHEFGHMLGLPDLYARPENPGSEGLGQWDAMSNQIGGGRPQHFGAWTKEQMGWLKPVLIDPRVKQKLVLAPVATSPSECFKIAVRSDGSEYFLLENRQRRGFDKDLPADGLLIWRVLPSTTGDRGKQQVYLEEAHGIEGPSGPRVFTGAVPFPSPANSAFTPFTTPSSRSQLGGGLDVNVTAIKRHADGRITFQVGYDYQ